LLLAAMRAAVHEWDAELRRAIAAAEVPVEASVTERVAAVMSGLVDTLGGHRALWVASFEIFPQIERSAELRAEMAAAYEEVRRELVALLSADGKADERTARAAGSLIFVLISGLITQWMVDPERAPSAGDMMHAMRMMVAADAVSSAQ
jgi:tetracycline repressor-like protein